ncbi:hypothetical protein [Modicisalibacter radicis]|uniref:hypothetical protein n=1 Tax=Halomonas sp. EAR18 TaxID=2518972 RepID=UPI0014449A46|nr:hypothetical protein [Halomonas sp. EAR18]
MKHITREVDAQGNHILMCDCGNVEIAAQDPSAWTTFSYQRLLGALGCVKCLHCARYETVSFRAAVEESSPRQHA